MKPTMVSRISGYVSLRPEGLEGSLALYWCLARAALAKLVRDPRYVTPGQFLGRSITVASGGLRFCVRPGTDDLNYALPGRKPSVRRWFRPAPGERVVEVGAHIGMFTVQAARAGARVIAFEPNPALADRLAENLRLNDVRGVDFHRTAAGPGYGHATLQVPAVGESLGELALASPPAAFGERRPMPRRELRVAVEPVDGVLASLGESGPIDWLLIDAEGSEALVLEGAQRALRRTVRALVEVTRGPSAETCRSLLGRAGLIVSARERQTDSTEYWRVERDRSPVVLPELLPKFAG